MEGLLRGTKRIVFVNELQSQRTGPAEWEGDGDERLPRLLGLEGEKTCRGESFQKWMKHKHVIEYDLKWGLHHLLHSSQIRLNLYVHVRLLSKLQTLGYNDLNLKWRWRKTLKAWMRLMLAKKKTMMTEWKMKALCCFLLRSKNHEGFLPNCRNGWK